MLKGCVLCATKLAAGQQARVQCTVRAALCCHHKPYPSHVSHIAENIFIMNIKQQTWLFLVLNAIKLACNYLEMLAAVVPLEYNQ